MSDFRAGAASLPLEPPLGLPMVGFIRQPYERRAATACRSRSARSRSSATAPASCSAASTSSGSSTRRSSR